MDFQPLGRYIKFKVSILEENGYIVVFDSGQPMKTLPYFGGSTFIEPYTGEQESFPFGHVTVYQNPSEN